MICYLLLLWTYSKVLSALPPLLKSTLTLCESQHWDREKKRVWILLKTVKNVGYSLPPKRGKHRLSNCKQFTERCQVEALVLALLLLSRSDSSGKPIAGWNSRHSLFTFPQQAVPLWHLSYYSCAFPKQKFHVGLLVGGCQCKELAYNIFGKGNQFLELKTGKKRKQNSKCLDSSVAYCWGCKNI